MVGPAVHERQRSAAKADFPLIHPGGGVLRSGAWQEVKELAEYLSAPVSTSIGARGIIPEDHPLCLIPSGLGAITAQTTADVVLLVGSRLGDIDFWGRPPFWGEESKQRFIQIDIEPQNIGLNRCVDLALVGDAKATLSALLKAVKKHTKPKREKTQLKDAREAQKEPGAEGR